LLRASRSQRCNPLPWADRSPGAEDDNAGHYGGSQLALAWVIAQDTVPIPGTKRRRWLEENAAAAAIALTDADLAAIDAASAHGITAGERATPAGLAATNR